MANNIIKNSSFLIQLKVILYKFNLVKTPKSSTYLNATFHIQTDTYNYERKNN